MIRTQEKPSARDLEFGEQFHNEMVKLDRRYLAAGYSRQGLLASHACWLSDLLNEFGLTPEAFEEFLEGFRAAHKMTPPKGGQL